MILRTDDLAAGYDGRPAIEHVTIEVDAGERVALLGPNGAGKTTTLLMLLGVVAPDAGHVAILGHPLPKQRRQALAQVGFAAGYLPLPEKLRVREYLTLYADLYGLRDGIGAAREALARFRIPELEVAMGTELSSGQKTLVGIAKATMHAPRLLVLDEPTASLDPDVALRVRTGLQSLCAEQGTALLVTSHNMVEVERLCERVVFLSAGRIVADGSAAEVAALFGQGDLEEVFIHLAAERDGIPS